MLAALLLTVISFHSLFAGTVVGFLASAALVVSVSLPSPRTTQRRGIYDRTTRGLRIYLATPRLRGLLAICIAVSAAGSMVIVNTVVLVQVRFGLQQEQTAWALAAFGAGSMIAALVLPRLLENVSDRLVMLLGTAILIPGLATAAVIPAYLALLPLWLVLGIGYSAAQTPSGRLLKRSAHAVDRPALFAVHFALSHACWLLTYPLAGWLGAILGLEATSLVMAAIALVGTLAALALWPRSDPSEIFHVHNNISGDHPHRVESGHGEGHSHDYVIDDLHRKWPRERQGALGS